jgi:hypothetical protein
MDLGRSTLPGERINFPFITPPTGILVRLKPKRFDPKVVVTWYQVIRGGAERTP